jgi:hypothetical protein
MEWTIEVDKLVMELPANQCPPTSIQECILVMTRSLSQGRDVVCELPCLKSIHDLWTVMLETTKSLEAYWIGSAPTWKQLHPDKTSQR